MLGSRDAGPFSRSGPCGEGGMVGSFVRLQSYLGASTVSMCY